MKKLNREYLIQYYRLLDLRNNLDLYEDESINQMMAVYDRAIKDIKARLFKTKGEETKKQLKALLRDLQAANRALIKIVLEPIKSSVGDVTVKALEEFEKIYSWDNKDRNFNSSLDSAKTVVESIQNIPIGGNILEEWVFKNFDDLAAMQETLIAARLEGASYRYMYKGLVGLYEDKTRQELITLARSYNQAAVTGAQEQIFFENPDIVKAMRWTAIMEMGHLSTGHGTCPRCAALDGQEYDLNKPHPPCPLHARCRCMWSPITLTWNELFKKHDIRDKDGNHITMDEMEEEYRTFLERKPENVDLGRGKGSIQHAELVDMPYGEFATGKGKSWLSQVVGPNRADLISSGKLEFSDLVNSQTGELYTLAELGYPITGKTK